MKEEINDKIKSIKQSFRLFMDGAVAKSMRDKGLQYHLNWGIPTTRLKEMAMPYGKDYNLAVMEREYTRVQDFSNANYAT